MSAQDPYLTVKSEVEEGLEQANLLIESYQRIKQTAAPNSAEVVQTLEDIDQILEDIDTDIVDLQGSVDAVSQNPQKYSLTQQDVAERVEFVGKIRADASRLKSLSRPSSQANPFASSEDPPETSERTQEEIQQEELYQQQLMEEQDVQLDSVFSTVGNLREQANTMGQELEQHAEMLEEFESAVDKSANKLQRGMKRVEIFLKKNEDSRSNCCIGVLIAVLIILLVLVVLV